MVSLTLASPAKLNLFLHITGRREDGYHNLQTVFQLIDYNDEINISLRDDSLFKLHHDIPGLPSRDNLIMKAAQLLNEHCTKHNKPSYGADISLTKRLPMGGGLGGGSSNAATTLIALNYLWGSNLSTDELAKLGLTLGADVPVFVRGYSAWAEGIGEKLRPIELPESWYLVIKPNCHVATAKIFSNQELTRDTAAIKVATFLEQGGHNDCENIVCQHHPEVREALQWLHKHGNARLTGTGACVFASYTDQQKALAVLDNTPTEWECFIAKGMNHSPLHHLLRDSQ
ncbi:MAG: 4-diphosphocytidyl-2-C-methyl-D-erythritol kinase [Candidatus Endobugula sp.]|jgi:4-diphosphocytidyl-2-C-methyl-D-erythritol kinase